MVFTTWRRICQLFTRVLETLNSWLWKVNMDPLVKLPPEILEKILSFLDSRDLCSFVLVNKRCLEIGSRPYLWKNTRISKRMVMRRGIYYTFFIVNMYEYQILSFSLVSNNLTNFEIERRHFKLFTNCHVSWDTLYHEFESWTRFSV